LCTPPIKINLAFCTRFDTLQRLRYLVPYRMEFVFFTLFHTFETERSDLKKIYVSKEALSIRAVHTLCFFFILVVTAAWCHAVCNLAFLHVLTHCNGDGT
jgi:hypothetical protein